MHYIIFYMLLLFSFSPCIEATEPAPLYSGKVIAVEKIKGGWGTASRAKGTGVGGYIGYDYSYLWANLIIEVQFPESEETVHTFEMDLEVELPRNSFDQIAQLKVILEDIKPGDKIDVLDMVTGDLFTDTIFFVKINGKDRLLQMHRTFHKTQTSDHKAQTSEMTPLYTGKVVAFEKIPVNDGTTRSLITERGYILGYNYNYSWETLYLEVRFPETGETVHTFKIDLNSEDLIIKPGDEIVVLDTVIGDLFTDTLFSVKIGSTDRVLQMHRSFHKVHPLNFQKPPPEPPRGPSAPGGWA